MVDSRSQFILITMRVDQLFGAVLVGVGLLALAPAQARDGGQAAESAARPPVARHELSKCMLQHMLADRMLSYHAANSLCLELHRAPRAEVADQTPGTMRKSRTAPSPKAASAA
jgi:F0F1-type ATP synthase membrane subunit c/vacuolar-type H+-ATPase subunit K